MKKDLTYYMKLKYKIEIIPIPKNRGGGFEASIPQLGSYAFVGQSETAEEALKDLEETKKENFEEYIEKGIEIPEPEEPKREFRGDFLLRMPTFLHESLYAGAKENNVSLNQYINYLLTSNLQIHQIGLLVTQCFDYFWKNMWDISSTAMEIEEDIPFSFVSKEIKAIGA